MFVMQNLGSDLGEEMVTSVPVGLDVVP